MHLQEQNFISIEKETVMTDYDANMKNLLTTSLKEVTKESRDRDAIRNLTHEKIEYGSWHMKVSVSAGWKIESGGQSIDDYVSKLYDFLHGAQKDQNYTGYITETENGMTHNCTIVISDVVKHMNEGL